MIDARLLNTIQERALRSVGSEGAQSFNLCIETELLRAGQTIPARPEGLALDRDTVMVLVDEQPLLNWGHRCRYLLYSPTDAQMYAQEPAQFPPYLGDEPDSYLLFHQAVVPPSLDMVRGLSIRRPAPCPIRGGRYALLFSGRSDWRHVNDLEFLYRCLVQDYHFRPDDIIVLNYNGTIDYNRAPSPLPDWPGNGTPYQMTVRGQGTRADLEGALDDLGGRLGPDDLLVLHTNNHGYSDGNGTFVCAREGPSVYTHDLTAAIANLPAFGSLIVMMEQCHAGGFGAPILAASPARRTSFSSACAPGKSSALGEHFDPFARDWIAALHLSAPCGTALACEPDISGDGRISAREAFEYADAVRDTQDTPVYHGHGPGADECHLWGM